YSVMARRPGYVGPPVPDTPATSVLVTATVTVAAGKPSDVLMFMVPGPERPRPGTGTANGGTRAAGLGCGQPAALRVVLDDQRIQSLTRERRLRIVRQRRVEKTLGQRILVDRPASELIDLVLRRNNPPRDV